MSSTKLTVWTVRRCSSQTTPRRFCTTLISSHTYSQVSGLLRSSSSIQRRRRRLSRFGDRTTTTSTSLQTSTTLTNSTFSSFLAKIRTRFQSRSWRTLAFIARYTRIPLLIASVYGLGYQQGIMDCTKTPIALQEQILKSILLSMGVSNLEKQVQVVHERDVTNLMVRSNNQLSSRHMQVATVGHKIVTAAKDYVDEQLQLAMNECQQNLPSDMTGRALLDHYEKDEGVQYWYQARLRLQGEQDGRANSLLFTSAAEGWQYIFIDTPMANAFVTEILPRRFFITNTMLEVATTANELAVVLGHEVSHLILGHVSQANMLESVLRTIEVLLLSIDPTSGFLALFVIGTLAATRRAMTAQQSRDNEHEADDLGLILAARACFDTEAGSHVMRKMNELKVAASPKPKSSVDPSNTSGNTIGSLMDTHPPSMERFRIMQEHAKEENYTKYAHTKHCAKVSTRLYNALWGPSSLSSTSKSSSQDVDSS